MVAAVVGFGDVYSRQEAIAAEEYAAARAALSAMHEEASGDISVAIDAYVAAAAAASTHHDSLTVKKSVNLNKDLKPGFPFPIKLTVVFY